MNLRSLLVLLAIPWVGAPATDWATSVRHGLRIPLLQGWTLHETDSSFAVSSNREWGTGTVVVGAEIWPDIAPWSTPGEWRTRTLATWVDYVVGCSGRLLTPTSQMVFRGDSAEVATYLMLDPKTYTLLAGQSRFLVHAGKGMELYVIGDTLPLYQHFSRYDSLLQGIEYLTTSLRTAPAGIVLHVARLGPRELLLEGGSLDLPASEPGLRSLDGRIIQTESVQIVPGGMLVRLIAPLRHPIVVAWGGSSSIVLP